MTRYGLAWTTCMAGMSWLAVLTLGQMVPDQKVEALPYVLRFEDPQKVFDDWKRTHGHGYVHDWNEEQRFNIFLKTLAKIESHNWKYHTQQSTYYLGLNKFSAMTHEEFLRYTRQVSYAKNRLGAKTSSFECQSGSDQSWSSRLLPDHVDWSKKGYTTQVKDQGTCGSCWTFSATGAMEGAHFKAHGKLESFSEQQLLDCCSGEGCDGCGGGEPAMAYASVFKKGGIETEQQYPYEASQSGKCYFNKSLAVGHISACYYVTSGDESALQQASASVGPISIAFDASHDDFVSYAGGVYQNPDCSSIELDHAMLLTGYGTDPKTKLPYWIIKNSWSEDWGVNGYAYTLRNADNLCGVATDATYVTMK
ncbi:crustapain [Biomphalaria glabrata]|uniref:Procathepsin L-like n=1 Tax=Biomphalaria glabrata TaxID=6526 RepID=A0A9W3BEP2_BIOGL|nr:procathepsin L-like [Biomphalaria glabrata]